MKVTFKQYLEESNFDTKMEYHKTLNSKIWNGMFLKTEVKESLQKIAKAFEEFLEISSDSVKDVILTGSNCGYNYTPSSDIDLHLVIDFSTDNFCPTCTGDFIENCFQAKKTLWNSSHDISIYGYNVELYAQDANEQHIAPGVFSLKHDEWLIKPEYKEPSFDNFAVMTKAEELMNVIDSFIDSKSDDVTAIKELREKIRTMRQAGLHSAGEYSVENVVFKALRNNGYLDKLSDYTKDIYDSSLSLT